MQRRHFIAGLTALSALPITSNLARAQQAMAPISDPDVLLYAGIHGEAFDIPPVDVSLIRPDYRRQLTEYTTTERPGTIVVDTAHRYLYLVEEGGKAMRYGVGLGRQGFEWSGEGVIQWKQAWPKWTPPEEMIARQPELAKWSASNGGMPPGLNNPLGARALYIFQNGVDTLYRIHGSPEYWTIGKSVSSGCVRMINQDVVDLYGRVTSGARLIVI